MTEWISVEEKMPEVGKPVLCANEDIPISFSAWFYEGAWHKQDGKGGYHTITVLYWQPLPPPPKKKRWMPKVHERCVHIDEVGEKWNSPWCNGKIDQMQRETFGVYKTFEEAQEMRDKIKAFVTSEIGEP